MAAYKRWLRTAGLVLLPALLFVWFLLPVFHLSSTSQTPPGCSAAPR